MRTQILIILAVLFLAQLPVSAAAVTCDSMGSAGSGRLHTQTWEGGLDGWVVSPTVSIKRDVNLCAYLDMSAPGSTTVTAKRTFVPPLMPASTDRGLLYKFRIDGVGDGHTLQATLGQQALTGTSDQITVIAGDPEGSHPAYISVRTELDDWTVEGATCRPCTVQIEMYSGNVRVTVYSNGNAYTSDRPDRLIFPTTSAAQISQLSFYADHSATAWGSPRVDWLTVVEW